MKKFLSFFTCFAMIVSMVLLPKGIQATDTDLEGILNRFELFGLEDGEVEVGDGLTASITLSEEVDEISIYAKYLYDNDSKRFELCFHFDQITDLEWNSFIEAPDQVAKVGEAKFLFIYVRYVIDGEEYYCMYTPLNSEEREKYDGWFESGVKYSMNEDYSFTGLAYTGMELLNFEVNQNGSKVDLVADVESRYDISYVYFSFVYDDPNETEGDDSTVLELFNTSYDLNTLGIYRLYPYGEYILKEIIVEDVEGHTLQITEGLGDYSIELNKNDNDLENITDLSNLTFSTPFDDGIVYYRKDTGVGNGLVQLNYELEDGTNLIAGYTYIGSELIDLSKVGTTIIEKEIELDINYETTLTTTIQVPVEVVEVIGEVVLLEEGWEICVPYKDYSYEYLMSLIADYGYARLYENDEIVKIDTIFQPTGEGGADYFFTVGGIREYKPMYYVEGDEFDPYVSYAEYTFYFVDDEGNLVNRNGDVIIPFEEREEKTFTTYNDAITIQSLYGALPSYTKFNATEVTDLDDVFDREFVAYDIELDAIAEGVQPSENVKVSIELPKDYQGEEVEVYYVDDNRNATLIESNVEDNKVTFETDHFSTYTIVKKDVNNNGSTIDKPNEDSPNTSDTTHILYYWVMLLFGGIVLLVNKKESFR